MDTQKSDSEKSESVSRRGLLTAASISAGASFLANDVAAQVNAVVPQSGDQLTLEETLRATQGALSARANLSGQIFSAVMGDIQELIVRSQRDSFKVLRTGLTQL